ncbi:unnamed protein product, partial [Adineta steineri]
SCVAARACDRASTCAGGGPRGARGVNRPVSGPPVPADIDDDDADDGAMVPARAIAKEGTPRFDLGAGA